MKAEYIEDGRFNQAIWLRLAESDFLPEYTHDKCISMDKAVKLFQSLKSQLLKAGRMEAMK